MDADEADEVLVDSDEDDWQRSNVRALTEVIVKGVDTGEASTLGIRYLSSTLPANNLCSDSHQTRAGQPSWRR